MSEEKDWDDDQPPVDDDEYEGKGEIIDIVAPSASAGLVIVKDTAGMGRETGGETGRDRGTGGFRF